MTLTSSAETFLSCSPRLLSSSWGRTTNSPLVAELRFRLCTESCSASWLTSWLAGLADFTTSAGREGFSGVELETRARASVTPVGVVEVEVFLRLGGASGSEGGPITVSEVVMEVVGVTGVVRVVTLLTLAVLVLDTMSGMRDCLTSLTLDLWLLESL